MKTKCQVLVDKQSLKKKIGNVCEKIPNTSGLVKKTDYNKRATEIENKIPRVTGLVITFVLNFVLGISH